MCPAASLSEPVRMGNFRTFQVHVMLLQVKGPNQLQMSAEGGNELGTTSAGHNFVRRQVGYINSISSEQSVTP